MTAPGTFRAIARGRCPSCHRGRVFRGVFAMNDTCPDCGLAFHREPGFFLGAMFFSYALATLILVPLTGLAYLAFPRWSFLQLVGLAWLVGLPMAPWIFRTSRVLWLHLDQFLDPRTEAPDPH